MKVDSHDSKDTDYEYVSATRLESAYQEVADVATITPEPSLSPDASFLKSSKFDAGDTEQVWGRLALAGAVCGVGILGINRYVRMPAKRMYGRIGVGAAWSAFAYKNIELADVNKLYRQQQLDSNIGRVWDLHMQCRVLARRKKTSEIGQDPKFAQMYEQHGYNQDERRLRSLGFAVSSNLYISDVLLTEAEGLRGVWISEGFRALAVSLFRGLFEAYGLSPEDSHRLTVIMAGGIQYEGDETASVAARQFGCVAAALGFLSPWKFLVASMFWTSIASLGFWMLLDPIRFRYMVHCGATLDDKERIGTMLADIFDDSKPTHIYPDVRVAKRIQELTEKLELVKEYIEREKSKDRNRKSSDSD
ncbi:hypothetical protein EIP91_005325 [Steccherinum ochraceum]|uniref:Uncharacterized protein n=1 Tax=Steccherinum ochraceum TaxID=92696 RepID=A0A4R0RMJ3_9APHY|nr:hypothetical protein EIP91_005325 [Steccherinum ochraceum]